MVLLMFLLSFCVWWMNEWMKHLYSALLCIVVHPKRFTIMWGVSPQPPPVCSIHLDDATAATGQRRQCAHHTPATGGEEREIEPIKWMGIIGRPWLTKASGGNLARTPSDRLEAHTLKMWKREDNACLCLQLEDVCVCMCPLVNYSPSHHMLFFWIVLSFQNTVAQGSQINWETVVQQYNCWISPS